MHLRTWKPSGTIREKMADFFVGGALLLQDGSYAAIPLTHRGPFMNKYGFQTETSGTVRVKVHYVVQSDYDEEQDWEGAGPVGKGVHICLPSHGELRPPAPHLHLQRRPY